MVVFVAVVAAVVEYQLMTFESKAEECEYLNQFEIITFESKTIKSGYLQESGKRLFFRPRALSECPWGGFPFLQSKSDPKVAESPIRAFRGHYVASGLGEPTGEARRWTMWCLCCYRCCYLLEATANTKSSRQTVKPGSTPKETL